MIACPRSTRRGAPGVEGESTLFSNAPITSLEHYRRLGMNAAAYARDEDPEPVVVPTRGEALGARFHAEVAMLYAIETALCVPGAEPEELAVEFAEAAR